MAEIELFDASLGEVPFWEEPSISSIFTTSYSYFVAEMEVELFSALLAEEPLMISSTFVIL